VLGRCAPPDQAEQSKAPGRSLVGIACAGLLLGTIAVALPSDVDFDKAINVAQSPAQLRDLLIKAQLVHPTDYFYALAYARTQPLKPRRGERSPRLHALNRALELCPGCELVHLAVARSLWELGSHAQSLVEWRAAVQLQPSLFDQTLKELARLGAKPQELAAIAAFDAAKMVTVADFLASQTTVADALAVLDEADLMGAPRIESLLTRGRLQIEANQLASAQTTLAEAHAAGVQDPRLSLLDAQLILGLKGRAGVDDAFGILDLAAIRYPFDLAVQRMRVSMVSTYGKWQAADRALDGLKLALYHATGSAFEANLMAARIRGSLGQWSVAFSEYRIALSHSPNQPSLWVEFARAAENAGRDQTAREAYSEAARLAPSDASIAEARRRLDARQVEQRKASFEHGLGGAP
jgi:tetratricopeptide (TPR) repeat protein